MVEWIETKNGKKVNRYNLNESKWEEYVPCVGDEVRVYLNKELDELKGTVTNVRREYWYSSFDESSKLSDLTITVETGNPEECDSKVRVSWYSINTNGRIKTVDYNHKELAAIIPSVGDEVYVPVDEFDNAIDGICTDVERTYSYDKQLKKPVLTDILVYIDENYNESDKEEVRKVKKV